MVLMHENKMIAGLVPDGEGGGHVIQDASGTAVAQEPTMQFTDSHVSDDSENDKTEVEVIKSVASADYSSETEDGLYLIPDGDGSVIEPASEDYEYVDGDNSKSYATLLNELYAKVDRDKLTDTSYVIIDDGSTKKRIQVNRVGTSILYGTSFDYAGTSNCYTNTLTLASTGSYYTVWTTTSNGTVSVDNKSSNAVPNDTRISLYYGNKKAVVDLQTTANRCWLNNGESVESALTNKCKILNGTVTNDFSGGIITKINFPTSFTKDNSVVISSYISADNGASWYPMRDGSSSGNYVYVESTGIYLYNGDGSWTGRKYRIALSQF